MRLSHCRLQLSGSRLMADFCHRSISHLVAQRRVVAVGLRVVEEQENENKKAGGTPLYIHAVVGAHVHAAALSLRPLKPAALSTNHPLTTTHNPLIPPLILHYVSLALSQSVCRPHTLCTLASSLICFFSDHILFSRSFFMQPSLSVSANAICMPAHPRSFPLHTLKCIVLRHCCLYAWHDQCYSRLTQMPSRRRSLCARSL